MSNPDLIRVSIYHFTSLVPAKRASAAFLICAFQVLCLNRTPEEAWEPFIEVARFLPYRDSGNDGNKFELNIIDCLHALYKAKKFNWFDINTFDYEEYIKYNSISTEKISWIVPDKLLTFPSPKENLGKVGLTSKEYGQIFENLKVNCIIRLNEPIYDSLQFKKLGFRHYDLKFYDGNIPNRDILQEFIEICRRERIIAVHCLTGIGKSATLIGCYVIKHFSFTGKEYIAWARMNRPGSVQGEQQYFLCDYYNDLCSKIPRVRPTSIYTDITTITTRIPESSSSAIISKRFKSISAKSNISSSEKRIVNAVNYKTKYNQLVQIDPLFLKLYSKKKENEEVN